MAKPNNVAGPVCDSENTGFLEAIAGDFHRWECVDCGQKFNFNPQSGEYIGVYSGRE